MNNRNKIFNKIIAFVLAQSVLVHPGLALGIESYNSTSENQPIIEILSPKKSVIVTHESSSQNFRWVNKDAIFNFDSENFTSLNLNTQIIKQLSSTNTTTTTYSESNATNPTVDMIFEFPADHVQNEVGQIEQPVISTPVESEVTAFAGEVELVEIASTNEPTQEIAETVFQSPQSSEDSAQLVTMPENVVSPVVEVLKNPELKNEDEPKSESPVSSQEALKAEPEANTVLEEPVKVLDPEIQNALESLTSQNLITNSESDSADVIERNNENLIHNNLETKDYTLRVFAPSLEFSDFNYTIPKNSKINLVDNLTLKLKLSSRRMEEGNFTVEYSKDQAVWKSLETIKIDSNSEIFSDHYLEYNLPVEILENLSNFKIRLNYSLSKELNYEPLPDLLKVESLLLESRSYEEIEDLSLYNNSFLDPENFLHLDFSSENMELSLPGSLNDPITVSSKESPSNAPLQLKLINVNSSSTGQRTGDLILYSDVFLNTDVEYKIKDYGLKESLILKTQDHPTRFRYALNLQNYDYVQDSPSQISLYKKGFKAKSLYKVYTLSAPYMEDSEGNRSDQLVFSVKNGIITLTPNSFWLKSASYPVVVDPTVEISVLNIHSHPIEGQNWDVEFTTAGTADLTITPADQATIDDMRFTELLCGSEVRQPEILAGDVIFYPNWSCSDIARVTHFDLKTGNHHLVFSFGGVAADAYNAAVSWDGGAGTTYWEDALNWSNDIVPTSTVDVVIGTATTVNLRGSTTIQSLTLGVSTGSAASILNFSYDAMATSTGTSSALIITQDLTVYSGASITHTAGTSTVAGRINLTVGGNANIAGSITADAKGYTGGNGPGGATTSAGGSYGGKGSTLSGDITLEYGVGNVYGSVFLPTDLGSGGSSSGGVGGGAIMLTVTGTTTVTGTVTANGATPTGLNNVSGAGSGGSVLIRTNALAGGGTIRANGGYGDFHGGSGQAGGNGGGGRVAIYYSTDNSTTTLAASGNYSSFWTTSVSGAGTIYKKSASQTYGEVIIDNDNVQGSTSDEAYFGTTTPLNLTGTSTLDAITVRDTGAFYLYLATSATTTTLSITGNGMYDARIGTNLSYSTITWSSLIMDSGGTLSIIAQNQDLTIPSGAKLIEAIATSSTSTLRTYNNITVNGTLSHADNKYATTGSASLYKLNMAATGNLVINSGGSVNIDNRGFYGTYGAGTGTSGGDGGGGSYGGVGGYSSSYSASGGPQHGSLTTPLELGSGGGASTSGRAGGGAAKFTVTGTTTVTGTMTAKGQSVGGGGAGSGGSIYIITNKLTGSGSISANGANGGCGTFCNTTGGGGGGGRIAIYYTTDTSTITYNNYGGTGGVGYGSAGTIYKKSTAQTYGDLVLNNNAQGGSDENSVASTPIGTVSTDPLIFDSITATSSAYFYFSSSTASTIAATTTTLTLGSNAFYAAKATTTLFYTNLNWGAYIVDEGGNLNVLNTGQNLTVPSGATLIYAYLNATRTYANINISGTITHRANPNATVSTATSSLYRLLYNVTGDLTINSGGTINVDSKGYSADDGYGAGVSSSHASGASYGGRGSDSSTGVGAGSIYGATTTPIFLGSGGGSNCSAGGSGGGAVIVTVSGTTTVNGTISANGGNGGTTGGLCGTSGGGSGGSIFLTTGYLTGTATSTITANGGNGTSWFGTSGGGGGGRIATIITLGSGANVIRLVNGGTGNTTAQNGTLYLPDASTVTTQAVSSIRDISATGNGTITELGYYSATQHGFVWATSTGPTLSSYLGISQNGSASATGTFTSSLTNLTANTTYYVRAYVTASTTSYGSEVTFTTASSTTFTQSDFRFYQNLDLLQPTTALAGLSATTTIYTTSSPVRLRMNVTIGVLSLLATSTSFKLQVATSIASSWYDINEISGSPAGWWNSQWSNRRKITFNNSGSSENLTNFPVLVSLNATSSGNIDYNKTQNSGQDIRFIDPDGTPLNYEIETWDESATSTVWVKVPQIDSASTTDFIWMYYNNTSTTSNATTTGVWDNNYALVFHMNESSGATTTDSTSRRNDGAKTSTTEPISTSTGAVGKALAFDGSNDRVNVANVTGIPTGNPSFSMEMWLRPNSVSGARSWPALLGNEGNGSMHWLYNTNGTTDFGIWNCGGCQTHPALTNGRWQHIMITSDGTTLRTYVNGVASGTATASVNLAGIPLTLAQQHLGESYFNGSIDEVRISSSTRSSSWIAAQYSSMVGNYNSYSQEEGILQNWKYYNNVSVASGTTVSATLLSSSNVQGVYMESNPTAVNPFAASTGQLIEYDFALDTTNMALSQTYFFRMVKSDGTVFNSYSNYPALTLSTDSTAPTTGSLSATTSSSTILTISISGASDSESGLSSTPYNFRNLTTATSSGATSSTSWINTGLSPNTPYSFVSQVTDYVGNTATTSTTTAYTLANVPISLSVSADSGTQLTASWNANSNPVGTDYYILNITASTSPGWASSSSAYVFTGLTCNTSYDFKVKARNGDGVETSYTATTTQTTSACSGPGGSGGGGGWVGGPVPPPGGFGVVINNGATSTTDSEVTLTFKTGTDVVYVAVSRTSDFKDAVLKPFTQTAKWSLCAKGQCPIGNYTVYAKFYDRDIISSQTVSDSIELIEKDKVTSPPKPKEEVPLTVILSASLNNSTWTDAITSSAPINNLNLRASLGGTAKGKATYQFDCTNNGSYELTQSTGNEFVTALSLCNYSNSGNYIANVKVTRQGYSAQSFVIITANALPIPPKINNKPIGQFEGINSSGQMYGWAQDPDSQNASVLVKLYVDKNVGTVGAEAIPVMAGNFRSDIGNHLFTYYIPAKYYDGKTHQVWAWATDLTDSSGANNSLLTNSPNSFTVFPPAPPTAPTTTPTSTPIITPTTTPPVVVSTTTPTSTPPETENPKETGMIEKIIEVIVGTIGSGVESIKNVFEQTVTFVSNIGENLSESIGAIARFGYSQFEKFSLSEILEQTKNRISNIYSPNNSNSALIVLAPVTLFLEYSLATRGFYLSVRGLYDLWLLILSAFQSFLTFLKIRSRRRHWGTVYDSHNKQPLDPAIVELINFETGAVAEQSITDLNGRFGFLDRPGKYLIRAKKTNYQFPSKDVLGTTDGLYYNLYHGELLVFDVASGLLAPNIPMDPLAEDWNQLEKKRMFKLNSKLEFLALRFLDFVFWGGFAWFILLLANKPNPLNLSLLIVYLGLIIVRHYVPHSKLWGRVLSQNGNPAGHLLELHPKQIPNVVLARAISAADGKFFLKAKPGEYILSIKKIEADKNILIKSFEISVGKNEVYNKDVEI